MPGKKPTGRPDGRPGATIDWKKVDDLMVAGCLGTEIAAYFGIHPDTFYRRVEEEKGIGFTPYMQEKRAKGDTILRAAQYDEAVRKRNTTMLVWLGKNKLNQTDKKEINHALASEIKVVNYGEEKAITYQDDNAIEAKVTKVTKESKDDTK